MVELYDKSTFDCSRLITNLYSTSFSLGIKTLDKKFHMPVYAIYGFVRYADEIVDTFHEYNKAHLLEEFRKDTYKAIEGKISMNPVLHAFQKVVNQYKIDHELIDAFLDSMKMDLEYSVYQGKAFDKYIYGSAEVVGLMCLRVFCEGDKNSFSELRPAAQKLGSAFQKVNFLRDMKSDFAERGRVYFPNVDFSDFTKENKRAIEEDIRKDFEEAYKGIIRLPKGAKMGVYLSYIYYLALFKKICQLSPSEVLMTRVRISDKIKFMMLVNTYIRNSFNGI